MQLVVPLVHLIALVIHQRNAGFLLDAEHLP